MFLAAVAHPRYDRHRKSFFDGKIGLWPFVETRAAKRGSMNRPKGAPVTTPLTVDKDLYRKFLIEKFFLPYA